MTIPCRLAVSFICLSSFLPFAARANPVLDWDALMMAAIRSENTGPTLSTRNLAILHCAIYDAVNSIERTHQPYQIQVNAVPGSSREAAVCASGRQVMLGLYPSFAARTETLYQTLRSALPETSETTNGLSLGKEVARRLLEARSSDGAMTTVPYIPKTEPGQWRRTPPFFRPPLDPHWRYTKLFALPEIKSCLPPLPPALNSEEYAKDFNEVKALGAKNSTVRTAEQTQIAVFWSDFSYTAMPPGHWHEIAAKIAEDLQTSMTDSARLFALLSIAQADAAVVCWEAKYRYNFWRPLTAIRRADEDENPATEKDAAWNSLLSSPNFPECTSGHSTFSKASVQVLTHFYGTDSITFTARSDTLPNVVRTYHSLSACADEVGMSRVYGGIHFSFSNGEGKLCGGKIGDYVCEHCLLPLKSSLKNPEPEKRGPESPNGN